MTGNKYFILFFCLLVVRAISAQEIIFKQTDPGNEAFRMKVKKNDKILIAEDSAYIYSSGMVEKINELEKRYLACLTGREKDLGRITELLASLGENYSQIEDILDKSSGINKEQLEQYQHEMAVIISRLEKDVASLQQLENDIAKAQDDLDSLRKEVKRERRRAWWKKTGGIIIAAVGGLAVGFLIGSS